MARTHINLEMVDENCRAFVTVVEELLARRREELADGKYDEDKVLDNWWERNWSRNEFEDYYTSYKQMRRGNVKHPPRFAMVMEIAEYLSCTLEERNRLLAAAHCRAVPPYLKGSKLQPALEVTISVANYLPCPAYVINRDWNILHINDYTLTMIGLSRDELQEIPMELLNVLQIIFNPNLPVYDHLAVNKESWEMIAKRNIYGFKMENLLSQNEFWYKDLVASLMQLPRFTELWNEIEADSKLLTVDGEMAPFPFYTTEMRVSNGELVRIRSLLTSIGNYDYPQIISYIPVDEASQRVFARIGLPTPGTIWP